MDFFKKHKSLLLFSFGIIILYFFTRLYNILELPIFTDEAIYVRWSQIAKNDANWRFISLTDGKQPILVWLIMISMRFIEDPLLAGRLVSVIAGFFTLIGLFFLGRELFRNIWIGVLSAFLYAVYPMALVYDRMALYDSLVGTFAVWSLYLAVLLVRRLRLDVALILGMVTGGGVLTKTSGFFSIYLLPITLLLFDFAHRDKFKRILRWIGLAVLATILAYMFYSVLRLSPFFHIISEKNALFVYPLKEWLDHPFRFFEGNMRGVLDWYINYNTWPIFFLTIGAFVLNRSQWKEKLLLAVWFIIPSVSLALFGRVLYPRFIFFMTLSLLPLAAFSLFQLQELIRQRTFFVFCFLFFVFLQIRVDYFILTDFANAPLPRSDHDQYINSWPSGGGIKESVEILKEESRKGEVYVATQGTFGLMPYALEIYLLDNPNVKIEGYWPIGDEIPQKVLEESRKVSTYFVFYQPCSKCSAIGVAPESWKHLELVYQYGRNSRDRLSLYRVNP